MDSLIGQQLGDYLLEEELGRGSMGVVYRAQHVTQRKPYAVKVLLDVLSTDLSFVTRFTREARIVASLRHPNIIRVFDAGRQNQHLYFAMEYFPAPTAGRLLKERTRLPTGSTVEIAAQAADALDYAHTHGHLVHRDIKPENLLVDRWFRVKVLDFGLARVEGLQSITRAGTVVGSLYYVSPEQLLGRTLDGRTDVYALGVSMYEMLTGIRPFRGQTLTEMSQAIMSGVMVLPSQIEPAIPPELERIIGRALARELEQRYATAGELRDDLRRFQATLKPATAANASPAEGQTVPATKPRRANRPTLRPTTLEPAPASEHQTPAPRDGRQ